MKNLDYVKILVCLLIIVGGWYLGSMVMLGFGLGAIATGVVKKC